MHLSAWGENSAHFREALCFIMIDRTPNPQTQWTMVQWFCNPQASTIVHFLTTHTLQLNLVYTQYPCEFLVSNSLDTIHLIDHFYAHGGLLNYKAGAKCMIMKFPAYFMVMCNWNYERPLEAAELLFTRFCFRHEFACSSFLHAAMQWCIDTKSLSLLPSLLCTII